VFAKTLISGVRNLLKEFLLRFWLYNAFGNNRSIAMQHQCWPDSEVHGGSGLRVARIESGIQRFAFVCKPKAHGRSLDYHEPTDAEALHDVWFEARKTVLPPSRLHVRLEKWGRDGCCYIHTM